MNDMHILGHQITPPYASLPLLCKKEKEVYIDQATSDDKSKECTRFFFVFFNVIVDYAILALSLNATDPVINAHGNMFRHHVLALPVDNVMLFDVSISSLLYPSCGMHIDPKNDYLHWTA